jgi:hypothetical protein
MVKEDVLKERLREDVPGIPHFEELWEFLKQSGRVDEVLGEPDWYRDLVNAAEPIADYQKYVAQSAGYVGAPPGPPRGQSVEPHVETDLRDYEMQRMLAESAYVASRAAKRRVVCRFRERFMDGELLTPEEADKLVASPAAAILPPEGFRRRGIPLGDHTAEVVEERCWTEQGERRYRVSVFVSPPGVKMTARQHLRPDSREVPKTRILSYMDSDGNQPMTEVLSYVDGRDGSYKYKAVPGVRVHPASLLAKLQKVGEELARRYPWREAAATRFVLTGEPPGIPPLTGRIVTGGFREHGSDPAIIMEVAPYVAADTVKTFYLQMQHASGGRAQQETAKGAAVFRFVQEQADDEGNLPQWPELLRRWNRAHPTQRYGDESGIRKVYKRASIQIAGTLDKYVPL